MKTTPYKEIEGKGFIVRPAKMGDLEEAVAMFNLSSREMIGRAEFTTAEYRREWQASGFDLEMDTRVVLSPKKKIVGCVEVWSLLDPPVHPFVWARVHPQWENQGIGTAMLHWAKLRAIEATFDRVPQAYRISMHCRTIDNHEASKRLLEGFGMHPVRQGYRMRIDFDQSIAEPAWPQGIEIQTYDHSKDAEAVYRAVDEAFQDHWGYVETSFEQGFEQWLHFYIQQDYFDPSLCFLAIDGDEIIGVALCRGEASDDPEIGWVRELCVRKPWRRKGLGQALLQHAFTALRDRGKRGAGLGVDADNLTGATRLYQRAGMYVERNHLTYALELRSGHEIAKETL